MRHNANWRIQLLGGTSLLALGGLLAVQSGCSKAGQAFGGGALEPVKVTLLTEGNAASGGGAAGGAAAGPKIEKFGTFKGKIVVSGGAPALAPLVSQGQAVKDAICSVQAVPNQAAVVGPGNGLANVFVFLAKLPNVDVPAAASDAVVLDQKGCVFVPHCSFIRVGQPLKLINSDPVAHNVKLTGSIMSFSSTVSPGDTAGVLTKYQRPERGPIPMACDFHGWMSGYQLALDHPWAAITKEDGTFEITGAPAGKMEFIVWHEKLKFIERKLVVEIPADGVAEKNLEVNGAALAAP